MLLNGWINTIISALAFDLRRAATTYVRRCVNQEVASRRNAQQTRRESALTKKAPKFVTVDQVGTIPVTRRFLLLKS